MTDDAGMRHGLRPDRIDRVSLLLVHLTATSALAGVGWVVQLVVYPSFRLVGSGRDPDAWARVHAAHTRAITRVVALPWAAQGASLAALLLRDGLSPLRVLTGAFALAGVAVTVAVSVPLHTRLDRGFDDGAALRLVQTNWLRTAAWSAGTVCAGLLAAHGAS